MWFVVLILAVTILYYVLRRQYSYWSKQKIPGPDPIPFFGNMGKSFIGVMSMGELISDIYRKYENYPFVGIYRAFTPCLLIRDVYFIKNVTVKDFKNFHSNEIYIDKDVDPLFGRNPFVINGEEWKKSRLQLTPYFTSGKISFYSKRVTKPLSHSYTPLIHRYKYTNDTKVTTSRMNIYQLLLTFFNLHRYLKAAPEFISIPERSSETRMKLIFPLISDTGKHLVEYVENQNMSMNSVGMEAKDLCLKFTLNTVAACAFGIDGKGFQDPNSHFRNLARKFVSPGSWIFFKMTLLMLAPKFAKFISLKVIPKEVDEALISIVQSTMKHRDENNIETNDFLDYVNQIAKSSDSFKQIDVVAHATSFFTDGYETSSQVMSFLLFELASNPEIQSKLREEIVNSLEKNNSEFSYESIQEMNYLDACMNESLRKNSVVLFAPKICNERYTYTPSNPAYNKITVILEPGTPVILPYRAIHMDPKYFQTPEKFMPERFLDKQNVQRYTFMPFGDGPRVCLGQRFGVLQVKTGVAYLVKNFNITVNSRTEVPLKYDPWNIFLCPKGGLWLNFHKI